MKRAAFILLTTFAAACSLHCDPGPTCQDEGNCVTVNPTPNHAEASWLLTGPNEFFLSSDGDLTICDLEPGDYTVHWNPLDFWGTPEPAVETLTLDEGAAIRFTGIYTVQFCTLVIDVEPDDLMAPWTLHQWGPETEFTGEGDSTLTPMESGVYLVEWFDIPGWSTPDDILHHAYSGETMHFTGRYEQIPWTPPTSPEIVLVNMLTGMEWMEIWPYENSLSDGDGEDLRFKFIPSPSTLQEAADMGLPDYFEDWGPERELASLDKLFRRADGIYLDWNFDPETDMIIEAKKATIVLNLYSLTVRPVEYWSDFRRGSAVLTFRLLEGQWFLTEWDESESDWANSWWRLRLLLDV